MLHNLKKKQTQDTVDTIGWMQQESKNVSTFECEERARIKKIKDMYAMGGEEIVRKMYIDRELGCED
jgi:hypothetical protein